MLVSNKHYEMKSITDTMREKANSRAELKTFHVQVFKPHSAILIFLDAQYKAVDYLAAKNSLMDKFPDSHTADIWVSEVIK